MFYFVGFRRTFRPSRTSPKLECRSMLNAAQGKNWLIDFPWNSSETRFPWNSSKTRFLRNSSNPIRWAWFQGYRFAIGSIVSKSPRIKTNYFDSSRWFLRICTVKWFAGIYCQRFGFRNLRRQMEALILERTCFRRCKYMKTVWNFIGTDRNDDWNDQSKLF